MNDELIELDEAPGIQQQLDALARGELSAGMLLGDTIRSAPALGLTLALGELTELLMVGTRGIDHR